MKQKLLFLLLIFITNSIAFAQVANQPSVYDVCDDDVSDGLAQFDLTIKNAEILGDQDPNDFSVSYYETQVDASTGTSPFSSPFTNNWNPQTVYARVEELSTGNYDLTTLTLRVRPNPTPSSDPENLELCDDNNSGDMIEIFDLTENEAYIINGEVDIALSYYTSQQDAVMGTNAIANPTQHSNEGPYNIGAGITPQTIYVRVSNDYGCYSLVNFDLIVHEGAQVASGIIYEACDDAMGSNIATFDLSTLNADVLDGQDPADYIVSYYETQADADLGINSLPFIYSSTTQTLIVRVDNNTMNVLPIALDLSTLSTGLDVNGDGTIDTIDLDSDGVFDIIDVNADGIPDGFDSDFDGFIDYIDLDGDGIGDLVDLNNDGAVDNGIDSSLCYDTATINLIVNNCTGIVVNAFLDLNNNGILDANESGFSNGYSTYEVNNDGIINTVTSSTGSFFIPYENDTNTYDITYSINSDYENCFTVSQSLFENVSVTSGNVVTIDFPITNQMACEDLAVYLVPFSAPRPGFNYWSDLVIENLGATTISSGTVTFINDPIVNYVDATIVSPELTVTPTATGATIDFTNLLPGETRTVWFSLYTPPTVALGEFVTSSATYTTAANDVVSSNNTAVITQEVIGSYDPNDITESHGKEIVYNDFVTTDEYLYYTIRFQNVGTAEAINVRIENTVDALLDISTLELLKATHDVVMLQNANQLTWTFENINLPAQSQDNLASNGYVHFKIKPTAGYAVGTIIPNTAEIYFDFNAPVVTNTFQTEFVEESLSVSKFNTNSFALYPNPATSVVNIKLNNALRGNASVEIIDVQGKVILRNSITETLQFNVERLQSGLYFVKLKQDNNETIKKLIIE